jgi:hypothetical protein
MANEFSAAYSETDAMLAQVRHEKENTMREKQKDRLRKEIKANPIPSGEKIVNPLTAVAKAPGPRMAILLARAEKVQDSLQAFWERQEKAKKV